MGARLTYLNKTRHFKGTWLAYDVHFSENNLVASCGSLFFIALNGRLLERCAGNTVPGGGIYRCTVQNGAGHWSSIHHRCSSEQHPPNIHRANSTVHEA